MRLSCPIYLEYEIIDILVLPLLHVQIQMETHTRTYSFNFGNSAEASHRS